MATALDELKKLRPDVKDDLHIIIRSKCPYDYNLGLNLDTETCKESNKSRVVGCRGITCAECWNSEMDMKLFLKQLESGASVYYMSKSKVEAKIYRVEDMFVVFAIPQYGGQPVYEFIMDIKNIDKLISTIENWT